jgi:hypothetical protein
VQRRDAALRARYVRQLVDVVHVVLVRQPFRRKLVEPVVEVAGDEQ